MKLVIFGLTVSSAWGNGHATLWRALCKALARRGHDVVFFERDVPYYASHRDLASLPEGQLALYSDWRSIRSEARSQVNAADAAIVTSYCPDALRAMELVLDSRVGTRAFYDLDSPVTLARLRAGEAVDYVGPEGYAPYDVVFSYAGGAALRELRERLGAKRVVPLYGSVDPDTHAPGSPRAEYRADLSYLGTYSADRQERLRSLLLEPARRSPNQRFLIGGALYPPDFPCLDNLRTIEHVAPPGHPDFFASCRLTLNVTRASMAATGWCPSGRLFEAAACGAPLLSDYWPGLEDFFEPNGEIVVARSADDAVDAIAIDDRELAALARRARERTLAEHTADRRAAQLTAGLERASVGPAAQPARATAS